MVLLPPAPCPLRPDVGIGFAAWNTRPRRFDLKALLHGVLVLTLAACSQTGKTGDTATAENTDSATTTSAATTGSSATDSNQPMTSAAKATQEKPMSAYENKIAEVHTTAGQINLRFFPDVA